MLVTIVFFLALWLSFVIIKDLILIHRRGFISKADEYSNTVLGVINTLLWSYLFYLLHK